MKDFQRISRHGPWSKIPQMARKTLTQTKMFSSIKPDEHAFLRLPGAPEVRLRVLRNHNLCVNKVLQKMPIQSRSLLEKALSLSELTVKRIRIRKNGLTLEAENEAYQSQEINDEIEFEVWGVVTNVIHAL